MLDARVWLLWALTVLVAKENKVTANFALVQPSLAVDAPRIGKALVDLVGGERLAEARLHPLATLRRRIVGVGAPRRAGARHPHHQRTRCARYPRRVA